MTPAATATIPAKDPVEARPAADFPVALALAAEPLALLDPLPDPLPPSVKPVAVAPAAVLVDFDVPTMEEVRLQLQDELKYAEVDV